MFEETICEWREEGEEGVEESDDPLVVERLTAKATEDGEPHLTKREGDVLVE